MKQGGHPSSGFTIVEVLIVLSVSSVMAVAALLVVNGRQNHVEFQTGANSLQQQLQQIINETQSGYFPSSTQLKCTSTSGNAPQLTNTASQQGTNYGCLFIGKALRFGAAAGGSLTSDTFTIYPLAGTQKNASGNDVQTAAQAHATAVAPTTTSTNVPDLSIVNQLRNGMTFKWIKFDGSQLFGTNAFAIVSSFAGTGGSLVSGGQVFSIYGFNNPSSFNGLNQSKAVVDAMNDKLGATYKSVALCFASGTTDQSGMITIGSTAAGGLGVTLKLMNGSVC